VVVYIIQILMLLGHFDINQIFFSDKDTYQTH
jgi:hypothetical protein